ncbi:MAG: geranylgeranylglyceryl/heptaprenylglyceryl phosphate synthase [Flavobacteriales bacterium]|jgi:putative glycerol-1-phosphate prenyltransferase|nr:geranylgeranylglyceryl/heptaprenylglyceryl phosphate synthase [Flavobacteriales bacterium]
MSILAEIKDKIVEQKKLLGILIDPDKYTHVQEIETTALALKKINPDYIFVGGSLINNGLFEQTVSTLKKQLDIPIILFPGNNQQISTDADGILLLSLISGRNADLLIGQHVNTAFQLQQSQLEIMPTGYLLINCGAPTAAQYMSNTSPIPYNKHSIAAATALAGEQLGLSLFYLDGGSGAEQPVSSKMIQTVKATLSSPLIVGGGIKTKAQLTTAWEAGADLVIIGTAFENNPDLFD